MAMSIDRVVATLNDLIETCKDGEQGFKMAAENIDDQELVSLFHSYARQRAQFAVELSDQVLRLGGNPEERGSMGGALHRGWINIKSAVTSRNPSDILAECERGEDVAVSEYRDALSKDLPDDVRPFVERQYEQIQDAYDHIRMIQKTNIKYRTDKPSFNY